MGANGHADKGFPEELFLFMLVRFDDLPDRERTIYGYNEVRRTRCIKWPKGMELPPRNPNQLRWRPITDEAESEVAAVFLNSKHLRAREIKLGWYDVTEAYKVWLKEQREMEQKNQVPAVQVATGAIGKKVEIPVQEPSKAGRKAA